MGVRSVGRESSGESSAGGGFAFFQQSANARAHNGKKFGQGWGLGDVGIGAELEGQRAIVPGLGRRQDQHRNAVQVIQGSHVLQDFEAGDFGKI
jgi:hypothetical protein